MGSLDTPHTCLQHVSHTAGESQAVFMLRIEPLLTPRVYLLNLFNFISSWREEDDLQDQVNKERRCPECGRADSPGWWRWKCWSDETKSRKPGGVLSLLMDHYIDIASHDNPALCCCSFRTKENVSGSQSHCSNASITPIRSLQRNSPPLAIHIWSGFTKCKHQFNLGLGVVINDFFKFIFKN